MEQWACATWRNVRPRPLRPCWDRQWQCHVIFLWLLSGTSGSGCPLLLAYLFPFSLYYYYYHSLGFPHFTNTVNLLLTISIFFRLWVYHSITIYVSCISFFHFWYLLLHAHAHAHSRIETCELATVNDFSYLRKTKMEGTLCIFRCADNVHCIMVFFVEQRSS